MFLVDFLALKELSLLVVFLILKIGVYPFIWPFKKYNQRLKQSTVL